MTRDVTVVKVGGSLLDLPDLAARLLRLMTEAGIQAPVLVVGGGRLVDELRRLDRIQRWSTETAHRLAIAAMSLTAEIVVSLSPKLHRVGSIAEAVAVWHSSGIPVLDCRTSGLIDDLPASWDVTSDSIAAHVADRWRAGRLVLLKSVPLPAEDMPLRTAVERGWIDPLFPRRAAELKSFGWCDFRAATPKIVPWNPGDLPRYRKGNSPSPGGE